jgi:hypothetical protein
MGLFETPKQHEMRESLRPYIYIYLINQLLNKIDLQKPA